MSVLEEPGRSGRLDSHARESVSIGSPGRCAKSDCNDKLSGINGLRCVMARLSLVLILRSASVVDSERFEATRCKLTLDRLSVATHSISTTVPRIAFAQPRKIWPNTPR